MEYVLLAMQFVMLYIFWKTRTTSRSALPSAPDRPALPSSNSAHKLVRVWKRDDVEHTKKGWWWSCSCGAVHPGSSTSSTSYGSEANALQTFKNHSRLYDEFAIEQTSPLETELNKVKKDFAEYRDKCYCKDANDDLLIMKKEGKWD